MVGALLSGRPPVSTDGPYTLWTWRPSNLSSAVISPRCWAVWAMRRTMIQATLRVLSKKATSRCHHARSFCRNTARRLPESSAYRVMNSRRVSFTGMGGAPTSMANIRQNHLSSLMHW